MEFAVERQRRRGEGLSNTLMAYTSESVNGDA